MLNIFTLLPTPALLRLTSVSRRFSALVLRLLKIRLLQATSLNEYLLLLECFQPSAKLTEPPSFCTYLGTDGLDDIEGSSLPSIRGDCSETDVASEMKRLSHLYSRFRPNCGRPDPTPRRWHPPGDIPGSRTWENAEASSSRAAETGNNIVTQKVSLEAGDVLTQLCAVTNLVKLEPRRGLISDRVELNEGIVRIWRTWLSKRSQERNLSSSAGSRLAPLEDERILWANDGQKVGIKLRVRQRKWRADHPILFSAEEELAVGYIIEYEGKCSRRNPIYVLSLMYYRIACKDLAFIIKIRRVP